MKQTPEAKLAKLKRLEELRKHYSLFFYKPYSKQREFHELGSTKRERLLMAGNRLGKTFAAGNEVAFHLTGIYPEDWKGKRFTKPTAGWCGSVTAELTREGAQTILLGRVGNWGTGCIPKELILDIKRARGVPDAVESVIVKHINGDTSQLTFKAYSDGREAWQAATLDFVWFDEEPPEDIYIEGITRTGTTRGPCFLTFTPLLGMSNVVMRFLENPDHADRGVVHMTIDDAEHIDATTRETMIASYRPHEREARAMGIPMLGSGRIFPVAEEIIREEPLSVVPMHWKQIIGIDFGWDHPTAAVLLLYDEETDCIHIRAGYRQREATPLIHAAAIRPWGSWIPVAWPHDGYQHDKGSGDQIARQYADLGLNMLSENSTFGDKRGNGVEAGVMDMLDRMQTGRWKVDANLAQWWEEFRMYHRKEGKIVKEHDDLLCASRYALMMLRYAEPRTYAPPPRDKYAKNGYYGDSKTWMAN